MGRRNLSIVTFSDDDCDDVGGDVNFLTGSVDPSL